MLQAELKVTSGKQAGNTIPLPVGKFLVGREEDCHLRPNSDMVSRHHCVFTIDEYAVRVRDLGSTNGTLVNGERIRGGVVLSQGDIVAIGKLEFEVLIHDPSSEATQSHLAVETQTDVPQAKPAEEAPAKEVAAEAPAEPAPQEQEEEVSTSATLTEMPAIDAAQADPASQTQIMPPTGDTQFAQPGMPMQPPIGYPMGYPPQMMQYGYPQQMSGYPPQHMPGYPPQQMPGYPPQQMPGYPPQQMPQQMPQQTAPEAEQPANDQGEANESPVKLPDPSTTGAKPPEPKPEPPAGEAAEKPADASGGVDSVIQQYLKRRPGSAQ